MFLFKIWPRSSVASVWLSWLSSPQWLWFLGAGERALYFWHGADILQGTFGWSDQIVWELLRVRRVLQEHGGVCTEREKELKSNAEGKKSFVDTFQPWALKRRLRREGNKKSSISWSEESGDILQQPKISSTVFVVLSCGVIGVLCEGLLSCSPRQKADSHPVTHILSFTALLVLCHLGYL